MGLLTINNGYIAFCPSSPPIPGSDQLGGHLGGEAPISGYRRVSMLLSISSV